MFFNQPLEFETFGAVGVKKAAPKKTVKKVAVKKAAPKKIVRIVASGSAGATVGGGVKAAASATIGASAKKNVSLFSFQWILPTSPTVFFGIGSNKEAHEKFNRAFVSAFPKLLYTNPSSIYTDEGWYSESSIEGSAETLLTPAETRAKVIQLAKNAGFGGDTLKITFSQKTIQQIEAGENLTKTKPVVNTKAIKEAKETIEDINDSGASGLVSKALFGEDIDVGGYKIPKLVLVGGAALGFIYLLKRR